MILEINYKECREYQCDYQSDKECRNNPFNRFVSKITFVAFNDMIDWEADSFISWQSANVVFIFIADGTRSFHFSSFRSIWWRNPTSSTVLSNNMHSSRFQTKGTAFCASTNFHNVQSRTKSPRELHSLCLKLPQLPSMKSHRSYSPKPY